MGGNSCSLQVAVESLALKFPFRISGHVFTETRVIVVTLRDGEAVGRGEAAGVYYLSESAEAMAASVETHRAAIEAGVTREELRSIMPPGGARNAVDCALWELDSRRGGISVWRLAGLPSPQPLITTLTLGADAPATMVERAADFDRPKALKLKLTGEDVALDAERVRAVRAAYPGVWIGVDGNQGFTPDSLAELLPTLVDANVELVEQPFARGREADMEGLGCPIRTAADESALVLSDVDGLVGRFDMVNIKLDKCGGLTEGLMMVRRARELGLGVMVGNMTGSSLSAAPAFLVGQLCDVSDLDGPTFIVRDREPGVRYVEGHIHCPEEVWGAVAQEKE